MSPFKPETNDLRADRAEGVVRLYAQEVYPPGHLEADPETVIQDFLTDLRHLCDRRKVDFHDVLQRANSRYAEER